MTEKHDGARDVAWYLEKSPSAAWRIIRAAIWLVFAVAWAWLAATNGVNRIFGVVAAIVAGACAIHEGVEALQTRRRAREDAEANAPSRRPPSE